MQIAVRMVHQTVPPMRSYANIKHSIDVRLKRDVRIHLRPGRTAPGPAWPRPSASAATPPRRVPRPITHGVRLRQARPHPTNRT